MKQLFCFRAQSNMQRNPSAAQRKKGWSSCAHFASSCASMILISMDTILMVSIFVILALVVLHADLCLVLLTVILTILVILAIRMIRIILAADAAFSPLIPNEQP